MTPNRAIEVINTEAECVKRQSGKKSPEGITEYCTRDCANCDLVLPDTEVLEAYELAKIALQYYCDT